VWSFEETGEKVWAGEANCRNMTWNDCKMVEMEGEKEIPDFICEDGESFNYDMFINQMVEVTMHTTTQRTTAEKQCVTGEWEDCTEEPPIELCQESTQCVLHTCPSHSQSPGSVNKCPAVEGHVQHKCCGFHLVISDVNGLWPGNTFDMALELADDNCDLFLANLLGLVLALHLCVQKSFSSVTHSTGLYVFVARQPSSTF
jgi:hypothetical protein